MDGKYQIMMDHAKMCVNTIVLSLRKRDCNQDGTSTAACSLDLYPEENSWHFITVTPTVPDRVIAFAISVSILGNRSSYA